MSTRRSCRRRRAKVEALSKLSLTQEEEEPGRPIDIRVLRRSLHGQIRLHYLDAISRLPTADLNTTLARGLLVAGHCYGPLHPVENILLNSIWYSAAFPLRPEDRIDAAVINRTIIICLVQRSLDGLVASLRHHCPGLSDDDALWHLSLSGADLRAAVASARGAAPSLLHLTESESEAVFQAAARPAGHPKPAALALFASSVIPSVERDAVSLLNSRRRLSSSDILRLSAMVLPSPLPDELPHPPLWERFTMAFKLIDRRRKLLTRWYGEKVQLAEAALRKYAQQTGTHYQLHIIYGLGVVEDEFNMDESYHISFMAWPKDPCSASTEAPLFFFAEAPAGSEFSEEDITLCCVVQPYPTEVGSCPACLSENFQVDHPDDPEKFKGGQYYNMDAIDKDLDCTGTSDADYRCFDPDRDIDFVECLDQDLTRYTSTSPWHRRHKDDIDSAISYYCRRYT